MAKQKLGRGFDALIPKDLDVSIMEEDTSRVQKVLISDIKPNPEQPRREFDPVALSELTKSVKKHGILQPIIVIKTSEGYRIVAGERRWKAAQAAQLKHIPAIVRSLKELEQIELALIENVQRVDLSPLEQALSVYKLQHQFNLTLEEIAEKLGKAQSTISNLSRLLSLPEPAREALREGKITEGHARAILALKNNSAAQQQLLSSILNNKWSVREAEKFVNSLKNGKKAKPAAFDIESHKEKVKLLSNKLHTTVKIKQKTTGGQIIIPFTTNKQLMSILEKLLEDKEQ